MNALLTWVILVSTVQLTPKLTLFKYSECVQDKKTVKVISINTSERFTLIKLSTYANCNGNFDASVSVTPEGKVDFRIWTKTTQRKLDGKKVKILELADCDCIFDFEFKVKGLSKTPESADIIVGGKTLEQIEWESKSSEEIKIELEDNKY